MASIRLPRLLGNATKGGLRHQVDGRTVADALTNLVLEEPALKSHLLDENSQIRQHVLVFVDGQRATLDTRIDDSSELQVLQAVSGG